MPQQQAKIITADTQKKNNANSKEASFDKNNFDQQKQLTNADDSMLSDWANVQARMALPDPISKVQFYANTQPATNSKTIHRIAASGLTGASQPLPYLNQIQQSFGSYDVSNVRAYTGASAAAANRAMGSQAYANGNNIAFTKNPTLFTAAHEATHVIQQRNGVNLKNGIGNSKDNYEREANEVARTVSQGGNVEMLLKKYNVEKDIHAQNNIQMVVDSSTPEQGKIVYYDSNNKDEKYYFAGEVQLKGKNYPLYISKNYIDKFANEPEGEKFQNTAKENNKPLLQIVANLKSTTKEFKEIVQGTPKDPPKDPPKSHKIPDGTDIEVVKKNYARKARSDSDGKKLNHEKKFVGNITPKILKNEILLLKRSIKRINDEIDEIKAQEQEEEEKEADKKKKLNNLAEQLEKKIYKLKITRLAFDLMKDLIKENELENLISEQKILEIVPNKIKIKKKLLNEKETIDKIIKDVKKKRDKIQVLKEGIEKRIPFNFPHIFTESQETDLEEAVNQVLNAFEYFYIELESDDDETNDISDEEIDTQLNSLYYDNLEELFLYLSTAVKGTQPYDLDKNYGHFRSPKAQGVIEILRSAKYKIDEEDRLVVDKNNITGLGEKNELLEDLFVNSNSPDYGIVKVPKGIKVTEVDQFSEDKKETRVDQFLDLDSDELPEQWITPGFRYISKVEEPVKQNIPRKKASSKVGSHKKKSSKTPTATQKPFPNKPRGVTIMQPLPCSYISHAVRKGRGKGQLTAMNKWSAYEYAMHAKTFLKLPSGVPEKIKDNLNYEWLHVRGAGLGGETTANNLLAGTSEANSLMIPLESRIKYWSNRATRDRPLNVEFKGENYDKAPNLGESITLKISAPNGIPANEKDGHDELKKIPDSNPFTVKFDTLVSRRNERFLALAVKGPLEPQPLPDLIEKDKEKNNGDGGSVGSPENENADDGVPVGGNQNRNGNGKKRKREESVKEKEKETVKGKEKEKEKEQNSGDEGSVVSEEEEEEQASNDDPKGKGKQIAHGDFVERERKSRKRKNSGSKREVQKLNKKAKNSKVNSQEENKNKTKGKKQDKKQDKKRRLKKKTKKEN